MYLNWLFFYEYKWAFINLHVRSGMIVISLNGSKTSFDIVRGVTKNNVILMKHSEKIDEQNRLMVYLE